ncbi:MAG TPA: flagellar biosynthetic protein FliO, partial [Xanthobacteraceae bacterium]|nr:flagellar biosynthetic protein FliO [Xanthobacteraceae bacterium]
MDKLIDLVREGGLYIVAGAAALVLALILIGWASRRPKRRGSSGGSGPRLAVLDQIALDDRRRLVLVRRDNVEHLLMIGGVTELVVESGAPRTVPAELRPAELKPEPRPAVEVRPPVPVAPP